MITEFAFKLLGGIGLFMLGMSLLTDGLKALAGDALKRALVKFTGTPVAAFASGTVATLLVQSSSATTITVIGFVSAGLITFPQAVGVVLGASLGTTGTGWIIATLGLKISMGFYALPIVGLGALIRLFGKQRLRSLGTAAAGFGLIFIGIETLQDGMTGLSQGIDLSQLPQGGIIAHGMAMALGIAMTVVMQSSSAAVATTLTALHTGAITFDQAASIVIGSAVGTTITGVLAAIGGNFSAKRTAAAHVVFNLFTGIIALILLPFFLTGLNWAQDRDWLEPGAMSLAAFHTLFIAVGIAIFLPIIQPFSRLIEHWIPESGPALTRQLNRTLLEAPSVALEATRRSLCSLAGALYQKAFDLTTNPNRLKSTPPPYSMEELQSALVDLEAFFPLIPTLGDGEPLTQNRIAQMHAMDHLGRLIARLGPRTSIVNACKHEEVRPFTSQAQSVLTAAISLMAQNNEDEEDLSEALAKRAAALAEDRRVARPRILRLTGEGRLEAKTAMDVLDAIRWLDHLSYHAWRSANYLSTSGDDPKNAAATSLRDIPKIST